MWTAKAEYQAAHEGQFCAEVGATPEGSRDRGEHLGLRRCWTDWKIAQIRWIGVEQGKGIRPETLNPGLTQLPWRAQGKLALRVLWNG